MSTPMIEPIEFEQRMIDDERVIYATKEWPEQTVIAPIVLRESLIQIDDEGIIVIKVANGYAAYKLAKEQVSDDGITVVLSDGGWRPPPSRNEE